MSIIHLIKQFIVKILLENKKFLISLNLSFTLFHWIRT